MFFRSDIFLTTGSTLSNDFAVISVINFHQYKLALIGGCKLSKKGHEKGSEWWEKSLKTRKTWWEMVSGDIQNRSLSRFMVLDRDCWRATAIANIGCTAWKKRLFISIIYSK